MGRNGTREADGIVQPVAHLIVPGMALLVTITHPTSKRSCWLITTWMVPFLLTFGRSETCFRCALPEILVYEDVWAISSLKI